MSVDRPPDESSSVKQCADELRAAAADERCFSCGCLHHTLPAVELAFPEGRRPVELDEAIRAARDVLEEAQYDCLGCEVCYPAVAYAALRAAGF